MSGAVIEVGAIAAMLNERIDALAPELLPHGRQFAQEWCVGDITGAPGRSLRIHLSGPKAGIWKDFGGEPDHKGDALELVSRVLFRGDKRAAIRWSRAWLGLDAVDPASFATRRAEAVKQRERKQRTDAQERQRIQGLAQKLWIEGAPYAGSPSEAYSLARGIDWRALSRYPGSLRHHPAAFNAESNRAWPCLIQAVVAPDGAFLAAHRTWLELGRDGVWRKAPLADEKMTLGQYLGGCVHLWRGATRRHWSDAAPGEWVMIGEGYEDTATAVMEAPEYRAAVAVSGSNMGSLILPAAVEGAILLKQNDTAPQAIAAFARAVAHYHSAGKRVRVADPPASVKDLNEMKQRSMAQ